ncbi:MAG: hypothetical protein EBZ67_15345 [Chitinophagia bacterium]|nr:hypothetical protein [Chitinophagia bacterium]
MELESLKEQINRRLEDPVGHLPPDIASQSARSQSLLLRLRRNLRIEWALYVLCLAFIAWWMWATSQTAIWIYDSTLIGLNLMVMWRIRKVIGRIDLQLRSGVSIREHMAALLDILEANTRQYLLLSVGIIPCMVLYGILLFHFFPPSAQNLTEVTGDTNAQTPPLWGYISVAVFLTALLMGVMYLIARLYIWWMFGKHIQGLRESLRDLESDAGDEIETAG